MERHAAFPDRDDLQGMRRVIAGLIENDLAEPAADHGPEHSIEDEINEALRRRMRRLAPKSVVADQGRGVGPAAEKSENIG